MHNYTNAQLDTYTTAHMHICTHAHMHAAHLRSPLALGYTRGHFSALVPPEPEAACGGAGGGVAPEPRWVKLDTVDTVDTFLYRYWPGFIPLSRGETGSRDCYLPLMTRDR